MTFGVRSDTYRIAARTIVNGCKQAMAIPDYETLMLPVLRMFDEGAPNVAACIPSLQKQFSINDDEAAELLPSGRITVLQSRAHWARTYLAKAGLLTSPRRNLHVITDVGREVLKSNPERIDNDTLAQFQGFRDWITRSRQGDGTTDVVDDTQRKVVVEDTTPIDERQTPEDAMAAASGLLDAALRDELLALLQQLSPQRFERLILDLLIAMGYGGGDLANGLMTKASGDGGIDGIIHEDALGLDAVYVQAKRYASDNRVSRPDVQRFIGSLTGEGATKGVFVTTSDFSKEAHEYLTRVQHRVVLINGQRLARLMIQHGVGVRVRQTYKLQSIDEDYFADVVG
ncbi:restriction endonuclease [Rhizobium leguminosarum]|uniref:restriction endonuclease n=1 Tax=Rhizobium leguminosarum TaxID=384 RepID=UPI001442842E|nr:restriction endonuclease [Rhizobium leguminosarum]NKK43482.1 restriction endonuclease [Rhizobium leguminosarum bv. viciae]